MSPFTGISCQYDIDGCLGDPCELNCTDLTAAEAALSNFTRGYRCECNVGYRAVQDICISKSIYPTPLYQEKYRKDSSDKSFFLKKIQNL